MLDPAATRARLQNSLRFSPGPLAEIVDRHAAAAGQAAERLWRRDASLWNADDPAVQNKIANRLGWLSSPFTMRASIDRIRGFADRIRRDGFTDVVLLGMGGSSLAPEVLRGVLGVRPGWPRFHLLDSTDPAAVRAVVPPLDRTVFVLASKSGTTIEPNALASHFRGALERAGVSKWADHFVAITDEGTELAARAQAFRELFVNPSDIGGRYSALSFFGLVPSALMGHDVRGLVEWATAMLAAAQPDALAVTSNPAVLLGLAMAAAAMEGRDKLTLLLPPTLRPFGVWVEQLIAESTGKQGRGIIPIVSEAPAHPFTYGDDRLFVRLHLGGATADRERQVDPFRSESTPVADIEVPEPLALGAEFVRWEVATAVAGALLGINPFDEPNVQQAKEATGALLKQFASERRLPIPPPDGKLGEAVELRLSSAARRALGDRDLERFLSLGAPGDYFSILAYLGPDPDLAEALHALQMSIRDRTGAATEFGYGPQYLHSTGQLHKGGPNTGVFVLFTAVPASDVPIPGELFTFGTLELAQAFGDFASLDRTGRRALHVHLSTPNAALIRLVSEKLLEALPSRSR